MQFIKFARNLVISGTLATVVLAGICNVCYKDPIYINEEKSVTDFIMKPNSDFSSIDEGFFHGVANNEGYYNTRDYAQGDTVDVLLMGSSHIRGIGDVEDTIAAQLEQMMNPMKVYSIGSVKHTFAMNCRNLDTALEKYQPQYVAIEYVAGSTDANTAIQIVREEVPWLKIARTDRGIPYVGLLMKKAGKNFMSILKQDGGSSEEDIAATGDPLDAMMADTLMAYVADIAEQHDTKVVLVYHPLTTKVLGDGTLYMKQESDERKLLKTACEENGMDIHFHWPLCYWLSVRCISFQKEGAACDRRLLSAAEPVNGGRSVYIFYGVRLFTVVCVPGRKSLCVFPILR